MFNEHSSIGALRISNILNNPKHFDKKSFGFFQTIQRILFKKKSKIEIDM